MILLKVYLTSKYKLHFICTVSVLYRLSQNYVNTNKNWNYFLQNVCMGLKWCSCSLIQKNIDGELVETILHI